MINKTIKNKQIFKDKLSGKMIAKDCFDVPMIEGEIILHASGSQPLQLRVLKILKVINKEKIGVHNGTYGPYTHISLKVRRATRGVYNHHEWKLEGNISHITTIDNAIVLTDPKPEILELFKDVK